MTAIYPDWEYNGADAVTTYDGHRVIVQLNSLSPTTMNYVIHWEVIAEQWHSYALDPFVVTEELINNIRDEWARVEQQLPLVIMEEEL